ncbi:MAG: HprK-related kinase B [Pseudomonadales bacterium]|nr:HprK-related kinase B [Pseudomonadales bacterium]
MSELTASLEQLSSALIADATLCESALNLHIGETRIVIRSNSATLLEQLKRYFHHVVSDHGPVDIEILAIERPSPEWPGDFIDWQRERGKTGRKDSIFDFPKGRLVRKVRTGMVFLQSGCMGIAAGPCLANDNQVVNFINAQYMNALQQQGWQTCHAAGLVYQNRAMAIAGFSGGGKSTLMLHTMENPEVQFMTNDRLFVRNVGGVAQAVGIPKMPRVNPGTLLHNERLLSILEPRRITELRALPREELWDLEENYDVHIDACYGAERICHVAPLAAFLVLNWDRQSDEPLQFNEVDLSQRRDLLAAIMKSPGPFFQHAQGPFHEAQTPFDEAA